MPNKVPLDMSLYVDDVGDEEIQLEIIHTPKPKSSEVPGDGKGIRGNRVFSELTDFELDEKINGSNKSLKQCQDKLKDGGQNLQRKIQQLENEKDFRERKKREEEELKQGAKGAVKDLAVRDNGRPMSTRSSTLYCRSVDDIITKTDCSGSQSKRRATSPAFSEELEILNPPKGKGPFSQLSPNTDGSSVDGGKDISRVFSGNLAGPSPRPGLRSSSRQLCCKCNSKLLSTDASPFHEGKAGDLFCRTCRGSKLEGIGERRFYKKQPEPFKAKESLNRNSPPVNASDRKGNGVKRSRQGVGDGESPEKVVELFSSEDEDKEPQGTFAVCQIGSQRKGCGTGSTLSPGMANVRIAYPSRDDPEAVEVVFHDLHRLEPLEFLNDTVIDFYIKYIQRPEVLNVEQKNKFYFFNSFFYKKLSEVLSAQIFLLDQNKKNVADLSKLRKWTKGTNIFEKEYLFVPIHDKWHWSLAIVCHPGATSDNTSPERCILHLDSMSPGHKSNTVFRLLRTYLIAEWEHQSLEDDPGESFQKLRTEDFIAKKIPVPQQENESDCGLFLLHYIECFLKEAPSSFKLCDVEQGKLFGRNWFKPSQASDLRSHIHELLEDFFAAEVSKTKGNVETIESSSWKHHEPEDLVQDGIHHTDDSDVMVVGSLDSPGLLVPTELVREDCASLTGFPDIDLLSGASDPTKLHVEDSEEHLSNDVISIEEEEMDVCSQANCQGSRKPSMLPSTSLLGSSADFASCIHLDDSDQRGVQLVVDLPIQRDQSSAG